MGLNFSISPRSVNNVALAPKLKELNPVKQALEEELNNFVTNLIDEKTEQQAKAALMARGFSWFQRAKNRLQNIVDNKKIQSDFLIPARAFGSPKSLMSRKQINLIIHLYNEEGETSDSIAATVSLVDNHQNIDNNRGRKKFKNQLEELANEIFTSGSSHAKQIHEKIIEKFPGLTKEEEYSALLFLYATAKRDNNFAYADSFASLLEQNINGQAVNGKFERSVNKLLLEMLHCEAGQEGSILEEFWNTDRSLTVGQKYLVLLRIYRDIDQLNPNYKTDLETLMNKFEGENSVYLFRYFNALKLKESGKLHKINPNIIEHIIAANNEVIKSQSGIIETINWTSDVLEMFSERGNEPAQTGKLVSTIMLILGDTLQGTITNTQNQEGKAAIYDLMKLQDSLIKVLSGNEKFAGLKERLAR